MTVGSHVSDMLSGVSLSKAKKNKFVTCQRKNKRQSPCTSHRMHKGISLFQKHGHLTITFFPFIIYMPFGRPSVDVVPWRTICPLMLNTFLDDSSFLTSSVSGLMSVTVPSNSPFRQIPFFPKKLFQLSLITKILLKLRSIRRKISLTNHFILWFNAVCTRLELVTSCVTGRHSNQLN